VDHLQKKNVITLAERRKAKEKGDSMKAPVTVGRLCCKLGMSRQNYYQVRRERQRRKADSGLIEQLVCAERAAQPRLGGRKRLHILRPELERAGVRIGRDRFFEVMREKSLVLERLTGVPHTTNSRHSLPVFHNLVKDLELTNPHQAWAADSTYIRSDEGFLYLTLVMDLWSRKIVGYHAGDTLEAEGTVRALEMALKEQLPKGAIPVHHSERGCQYCSHRYVEKLKAHGLSISMTKGSALLRKRSCGTVERDSETGISPWLFVPEQEAGACGGVPVQHLAASSGP
jgi:transposase InsO family protein